jgi:hypothetical protein
VICAWLDALGPSTSRLIPDGELGWIVRRAEALADGLLDLAVGITVELRRPASEQSPSSLARSRQACLDAVHEMECRLPDLPAELTLGHIAFGCPRGYLDFRPQAVGPGVARASPGPLALVRRLRDAAVDAGDVTRRWHLPPLQENVLRMFRAKSNGAVPKPNCGDAAAQ